MRFSDDYSQTYASPDQTMTQRFSDDNSQTYAYASTEEVKNQSSPGSSPHDEPYNSLDFNPQRSPPVDFDSTYNRIELGSSPVQGGMGSLPLPRPVRVKGNTYEDVPTELMSEASDKPAKGMPPYAKVNKGQKGVRAPPYRTSSLKIKEDIIAEDGDSNPMSPRYTVVEPDVSESDSEDVSQAESDFGPTSPLYAEACHDDQFEDADKSSNKTRMPPYAKVNKNKNKKSTKTKAKSAPDVYDKLQRPLTTFTIDDSDDTELDPVGEYSHLIANPHVKKGYSKLDYGSPASNSSKPPSRTTQFMSANMYAELQVSPEN